MFIILSQQILSNRFYWLLLMEKSNFNSEFKLELITNYHHFSKKKNYHLKLLEKCYENFVNITLYNKEIM